MDEEGFELIKDLSAPTALSSKKYEELKTLMSDHLDPKPNEVMERNKFLKASQEQTESVAEFAARLKKLSAYCEFQDLKTALRNQLVCGLRDYETKVSLFKMYSLDYDTAFKEAVARETALKNASNANTSGKNSSQNEIFLIQQTSRSDSQNFRFNQRGNPRNHTSWQHQHQQQVNSNVCWNCGGRGYNREQCPSPAQNKQSEECASCGETGHPRYTCKFRNATCKECQKKGHIEKICFAKQAKIKKQIKLLENDSEDDEVFFVIQVSRKEFQRHGPISNGKWTNA